MRFIYIGRERLGWLDWKKYSREDAYTVSVFNEVAREVAGRNVTK